MSIEMSFNNNLNEKELCLTICQLKRENNCLKTDLLRYKLLSNSYQRLVDRIKDQIFIDFDFPGLRQLKNRIKVLNRLNQNQCYVLCEELDKNHFNFPKSETNVNKSIETNEVSIQTTDKTVSDIGSQTEVNTSEASTQMRVNVFKTEVLDEKDIKLLDLKIEPKVIESTEVSTQTTDNQNNNQLIDKRVVDIGSQTHIKAKEVSTQTKFNECLNRLISKEVFEENDINMSFNTSQESNQQIMNNESTNEDNSVEVVNNNKTTEKSIDLRKKLTIKPKVIPNKKSYLKYVCNEKGCAFSGDTQSQLNDHKLNSHSEDRHRFKCLIDDCNKTFKTEKYLKRHQWSTHLEELEGILWIECSENDCNFRTKSTFDYCVHMSEHTLTYDCSHCSKCFESERSLDQHMKSVHEILTQQYFCQWIGCQMAFDSKNFWRRHMTDHWMRKRTPNCPFPECSHKFYHDSKNVSLVAQHIKRCH